MLDFVRIDIFGVINYRSGFKGVVVRICYFWVRLVVIFYYRVNLKVNDMVIFRF